MEENNLWHDCKTKSCAANFSGTCRQPYLRCENNIDIAFKALENEQMQTFCGCEEQELYFEFNEKTMLLNIKCNSCGKFYHGMEVAEYKIICK